MLPDNQQPLVTVVMNGFNSARYLKEAVESVRAQTYRNWELVFWDNRSTDATGDIVRSFQDPRIRFYVAPHLMTLAAGRNAALRHARGEWIAFLDCDDLWKPRKLELQLERLSVSGFSDIGLIYTRTESFSSRGSEGETVYRYENRALPEGNIIKTLLREGNLIPIVSAMISRQAWETAGPIPECLTFAEDYWLFTAISERYRVLCVQETVSLYRVHDGSATFRNKLTSHQEALSVLQYWKDRLSSGEYRKRTKQYQTLIGLEQIRAGENIWGGIKSIMWDGSLMFLLAGTARTFRRKYLKRHRAFS